MSKQFRVSLDPQLLKPVIEAMIFASEEPLSARALIRLLAGERENAKELEEELPVEDAVDEAAGEAPAETLAEAPAEESASEEAEADEASGEGAPGGDAPEAAEQDERVGEEPEAEEEMLQVELEGSTQDLVDAVERAEARRAGRADNGVDVSTVRVVVAELNEEYEATGRSFRIVEVAGGYQFATTRDYGEYVVLLSREKLRRRLSPAALETLAIIAYRQPVSKPEVEAIRGVNCDQVLVNLMEKNLVVINGRSEGVGRPLLYGTTEDFLRSFGLKGIGDLPKLREIEELMEDGAYSAEKAEVITVDANTDVEEIEARVGAAGHSDHAGEEERAEAGGEASDDAGVPDEEGREEEESGDGDDGDDADVAGDEPGEEEEELEDEEADSDEGEEEEDADDEDGDNDGEEDDDEEEMEDEGDDDIDDVEDEEGIEDDVEEDEEIDDEDDGDDLDDEDDADDQHGSIELAVEESGEENTPDEDAPEEDEADDEEMNAGEGDEEPVLDGRDNEDEK